MSDHNETRDNMNNGPFLLRRGSKRKAHLARYDQFGRIAGAWCGQGGHDLTSNVPWGRPTCKHCLRRETVAWEAGA